jgi:hypothetical protein
MTGSAADDAKLQPHIRNKKRREDLAKRFKDPNDPMKLVIVRDMWLTGFDVPCLHTMYADKPMQGHGLMQAIARVNRVFSNKPGGLVVDYLGLADQLHLCLPTFCVVPPLRDSSSLSLPGTAIPGYRLFRPFGTWSLMNSVNRGTIGAMPNPTAFRGLSSQAAQAGVPVPHLPYFHAFLLIPAATSMISL